LLVFQPESLAVAQWATENDAEALFFTPTAASTNLAEFDNLFRLSMNSLNQVYAILHQVARADDKDAEQPVLLSVIRDDEFGRNIAQNLQEQADLFLVTVPEPIIYPDVSNAEDARAYLNQLALDQYPNRNVTILLVAFDEVVYYLEALTTEEQLQEHTFFLSGSLLDNRIISTPELEAVARKIGLYTFVYQGNEVHENPHRTRFFEQISSRTGLIASPYTALSYDCFLIILDTARVYQTTDIESLRHGIIHEARYEYGMSGWLEFSEDRERISGEFLDFFMFPSPNNLNLTWVENAIHKIVPDLYDPSGAPDVITFDIGMRMVPTVMFSGCNEFTVTVEWRDIDRIPRVNVLTRDDLPDGAVLTVPSYDTSIITLSCNNSALIWECASSIGGADVGCKIRVQSETRGLPYSLLKCTTTAMKCGKAVANFIKNSGVSCFTFDWENCVSCLVDGGCCVVEVLATCAEKNWAHWCLSTLQSVPSPILDKCDIPLLSLAP